MRILSGSTKIAFGIGMGIVAAEVLKDVLPAFRGLARPFLKATVKSGLTLAQDSRLRMAELRQTLAEVTAEVRNEIAGERAGGPPPAAFAEPAGSSAGVM